MSSRPRGILFLCVANSARSQMAEGLARALLPGDVPVYSAGSNPGMLNPHAVTVMREAGIDISAHYSKGVEDVPRDRIGTVVTLCAEEICPVFGGKVRRLHWPLPDPAMAAGSAEEVLAAFRRTRDRLREMVPGLLDSIPAAD